MAQNNDIRKADTSVVTLLYGMGLELARFDSPRYYCRALVSLTDTVERIKCLVRAGIRCYKEYLVKGQDVVSAWVVEVPDDLKLQFSAAARRAGMLVKPVMTARLPTDNPDRNRPAAPFNPVVGQVGQAGVHPMDTTSPFWKGGT